MDNAPFISQAIVVKQDPTNYGVFVLLSGWGGGQGLPLSVKVMTHGPRDAVRGHFHELPTPGTVGIVAFARGDNRNGVWIGSIGPTQNDSSPYAVGTTGLDYHARYSGAWNWSGADGTEAYHAADGSTFLLGTAMPAPTRWTVDSTGKRTATPYTAAQRVPQPPTALPASITLASGVSVSVTAGGVATVSCPGGVSIAINGGTVTITATRVDINAGTINLGSGSGGGAAAVARIGDITSNGGTIISSGVTTTEVFAS